MMLVIIHCEQLLKVNEINDSDADADADADADDDGVGVGGVPDEAVLPEDVEELPGQGTGHRPHLLLHNVRHARHLQLDNLTLAQLSDPGTAKHDRQ